MMSPFSPRRRSLGSIDRRRGELAVTKQRLCRLFAALRTSLADERRSSTSGGIFPAIPKTSAVPDLRKGATTMRKRTASLVLGALCFCCAMGVIALRIAWSTPPIGVVATTISGPVSFDEIDLTDHTDGHHVRIKVEGLSDVYVRDATIAPGGQSGWHTHPGPAFVSVKSGVATEYHGDDDDCTPIVHPAGTGFIENTGHVHNVRNEGTDPLELVVFFLLPQGAPVRIDMPNPGNCPF
jgi:quercetin dioxygenase-like cupin family protein